MEFLLWNEEKMSIGINLIDEQHKKLLHIINKLSTSIEKNSQKEDILTIINESLEYAKFHFVVEEELFDKFNYSDTVEHKKEHTEFVNKFTRLKDKITTSNLYLKKNAIEIVDVVFKFIIKWFLNHVTESDRKYVELFKKIMLNRYII